MGILIGSNLHANYHTFDLSFDKGALHGQWLGLQTLAIKVSADSLPL